MKLREEVLDQQRDVLAALAQRRHDEVNDVDAVEQVLAELPLRDQSRRLRFVAAMTRTLVALRDPLGADLLDFAGLEEPEQQPLHPQRHLADLVEEDRAVVGHLELAGLVAIGAGEAALHVAEQLGLEQRLGNAGAVDRHEGCLARGLAALMARATTSLPTPLSPVMRTLASERATRSTSAFSSEIDGLVPIS